MAKPGSVIASLPMQVQPGETFSDEAGTWEVITRPTSGRGGKNVTVKVQTRTLREEGWPAYERVAVIRLRPP